VVYGSWYGTFLDRLRHILNRNTKKQARRNIHSHYDLGNEFYKLWLDPTMTYSSAIFPERSQSGDLMEAQLDKYDRIIDALDIRSGDRVLEIGCGWGGFFSRAVERKDCHVTAVTISSSQATYDEDKIEKQGMKKNVSLLKTDYRDIAGQFDKIVSIEMIEAVGEQYWGQFFSKVSSSLRSKGTAMIQGITIREDLFYSYRKNTDFIQQYVFPGGMLLTNQVFDEQSRRNDMNMVSVFEFGSSYAETLKQWRENFQKKAREVQALGFDDRFMRLWNLYLAYCEGAFRAGRINVGQFQMERI
jgi:cyclopropane-fatty-acyl-phospholipid synthase